MKSGKEEKPLQKRARKRAIWIATSTALFLLCVAAFFVHEAPVQGKFAWLSPGSFARGGPAGPLTQLRRRLQKLPGISSLVTRYRNGRPNIVFNMDVWTVPTTALEQTGLGPPMTTNVDGLRVWILPANGATNFNARLKDFAGTYVMMRPRVQILNGTQGQIQAGDWVNVTGTNLFQGLMIDLGGKIFSGAVKMSVGVTATGLERVTPEAMPTVRTNVTSACSVVLPDGGVLVLAGIKAEGLKVAMTGRPGSTVLAGGNLKMDEGKVYCIVLSPAAMDSRGKLIGK